MDHWENDSLSRWDVSLACLDLLGSAAERKGDGFESDPLFNRQQAEFLKELARACGSALAKCAPPPNRMLVVCDRALQTATA